MISKVFWIDFSSNFMKNKQIFELIFVLFLHGYFSPSPFMQCYYIPKLYFEIAFRNLCKILSAYDFEDI